MHPIRGVRAGFIATLVLSALMVAKHLAGWVPALDAVHMLHRLIGGPAVLAWLAHGAIGTVIWGGVFGLLDGRGPGRSWPAYGVFFGVMAWLAMMLVFLPVVGDGFFGLALGWRVAGAALALHVVYGGVLGLVYAGRE